jgi:hypothetical protein
MGKGGGGDTWQDRVKIAEEWEAAFGGRASSMSPKWWVHLS